MNTKRKKQIIKIAKISIIASLYFVLTIIAYPISFGAIQIRLSEILLLLCFFDKRYSYALIIGCFCANLLSPMALLDIVFGTLQTVVACLIISYIKPLLLSFILSSLSMVIIGLELSIWTSMNMFWLYSVQVIIGEAIVLFVIAYPLSFLIQKSKTMMKIINIDKVVE